jgi:hypothetical protein
MARQPWDEDIVEDSEPEREEQRRQSKATRKHTRATNPASRHDIEVIDIDDTVSKSTPLTRTHSFIEISGITAAKIDCRRCSFII